jgi:hypothetical protein
MANKNFIEPLVEQVMTTNPDNVKLPILQKLIQDIQMKSPDEIQRDNKYWSDTNWKQWRQHGSHNPW